jgi:hypothetical protein
MTRLLSGANVLLTDTWAESPGLAKSARSEKLVERLPVTGELLRGTLLERVIRHKSGCAKCARGEGHTVHVLTVSYGGGRTQQISVRRERVAEVRRWLDNYRRLKEEIEAICELNQDLLRPDPAVPRPGRKRRD